MWQQEPRPAVCSCSAGGVIHRYMLSSGSQNGGRGQSQEGVCVVLVASCEHLCKGRVAERIHSSED